MFSWLKSLLRRDPPCLITKGGGAHFGDDLWTCSTCGEQKYSEVFRCRVGRQIPFMELPCNPWKSA